MTKFKTPVYRLSETKLKIIRLCSKRTMRWTELRRVLSITDKTLNKHLKQLVKMGILKKGKAGYETLFKRYNRVLGIIARIDSLLKELTEVK